MALATEYCILPHGSSQPVLPTTVRCSSRDNLALNVPVGEIDKFGLGALWQTTPALNPGFSYEPAWGGICQSIKTEDRWTGAWAATSRIRRWLVDGFRIVSSNLRLNHKDRRERVNFVSSLWHLPADSKNYAA